MSSFGIGVYLLTVTWFITLMLCWVSVRTGHYVGKIAIGVSFVLTVILVCLPKGDVQYTHGANFYDRLYVPRYAILSLLLVGAVVGCAYCFVYVCLTPVETRKVRSFGTSN